MLKKILKKVLPTTNKKQFTPPESSAKQIKMKDKDIYSNLDKTLAIFKSIYTYPTNTDIVVRHLRININNVNRKATIFFIHTITNSKNIEDHIINPLLRNHDNSKKVPEIITAQSIATKRIVKDILADINNGNAILFIDGSLDAYCVDVSYFQERNIEKAENEVVLKGPKASFTEGALTNMSLIRKQIKNENLIMESVITSERSKNEVFIIYIKDLANEDIIKNAKERIHKIDTDSIQNLAILEQYIEDRPLSVFPSLLHTERPDRATSHLENGSAVLLMDNSPDALILPATFWTFFHLAEDHYLRFINANFIRMLRVMALAVTLFSSALYIAVTGFHAEMIPPNLLLAVAATREKVPFPPLIEILLMEFAFELIREAGLRVPTPIGPTIGIVGALILGQAAVDANIVSPIVVIIVALGGLSSFALGDMSLNFAVRIIRFALITSAALFGIYGMVATFAIGLFYLLSLKSFGVPYMAPSTPKYTSSEGTAFRNLIKGQKFRPGYLKPKDITKK